MIQSLLHAPICISGNGDNVIGWKMDWIEWNYFADGSGALKRGGPSTGGLKILRNSVHNVSIPKSFKNETAAQIPMLEKNPNATAAKKKNIISFRIPIIFSNFIAP